jgi:hypothetical protein
LLDRQTPAQLLQEKRLLEQLREQVQLRVLLKPVLRKLGSSPGHRRFEIDLEVRCCRDRYQGCQDSGQTGPKLAPSQRLPPILPLLMVSPMQLRVTALLVHRVAVSLGMR